jgi:hypothetical protein
LKTDNILIAEGLQRKVDMEAAVRLSRLNGGIVRVFLTGLFLAGILAAGASASTIYVAGLCGFFDNPGTGGSGSFTCPTAASLGVTDVAAEFIVYTSDYSNGMNSSVSVETDWTISGVTAQFSTDTTTATGAFNSTLITSSDGNTLNPLITLPTSTMVLAGFYDNVFGFGTPTISYVNKTDTGSDLAQTGYAEVVYAMNIVASPVPEPGLIPVAGAGLLALVLYRRKKTVAV